MNGNEKNLGFKELVAIAVGGMLGGDIFTILGIAVSIVGFMSPLCHRRGRVTAYTRIWKYHVFTGFLTCAHSKLQNKKTN